MASGDDGAAAPEFKVPNVMGPVNDTDTRYVLLIVRIPGMKTAGKFVFKKLKKEYFATNLKQDIDFSVSDNGAVTLKVFVAGDPLPFVLEQRITSHTIQSEGSFYEITPGKREHTNHGGDDSLSACVVCHLRLAGT